MNPASLRTLVATLPGYVRQQVEGHTKAKELACLRDAVATFVASMGDVVVNDRGVQSYLLRETGHFQNLVAAHAAVFSDSPEPKKDKL